MVSEYDRRKNFFTIKKMNKSNKKEEKMKLVLRIAKLLQQQHEK